MPDLAGLLICFLMAPCLLYLDENLGSHSNDAELFLKRRPAILCQWLAVERDELVIHSEAATSVGLRVVSDRHHLVLRIN